MVWKVIWDHRNPNFIYEYGKNYYFSTHPNIQTIFSVSVKHSCSQGLPLVGSDMAKRTTEDSDKGKWEVWVGKAW